MFWTHSLLGNRYGRLTVVGTAPHTTATQNWLCACDCGAQRSVSETELEKMEATSCGTCKVKPEKVDPRDKFGCILP